MDAVGCSPPAAENGGTETVQNALASWDAGSTDASEADRIQAYLDARYKSGDVLYSFNTKFGQTVDCIDFFAQQGVKALALRGTPITEIPEPPPIPASVHVGSASIQQGSASEFTFNGSLDENGNARTCPQGSVPEIRVTVDAIWAAGGLDAYIKAHSLRPQPTDCTQQFGLDFPTYAHVQETFNNSNVKNIAGGEAIFSIHAPPLPLPPYPRAIASNAVTT